MKTPIEILGDKIHSGRRLFYGSIELTYACNFACGFCYNPVPRQGQERMPGPPRQADEPLELPAIFSMLGNMKRAGILYLTITGGEPMVHPHFWDVLERTRKESFAARLFTNGSLIDEGAARKLAEMCPNCIEVSLYGASESSYERSSGRGAAFPKVMKALELLKKEGITVYLKCMLTSVTETEMDKIQAIADGLGFPLNWDPVLQVSDDGQEYPLKMAASKEALRRLYGPGGFRVGDSPFENGDRSSACNIGRNLIHVDPWGNIHPCSAWNESLGNVRNTDIAELWNSSARLRELMEMAENAGRKVQETGLPCRHCMGKSKQVFGDPFRVDEREIEIAKLKSGTAPD